MISKKTIFDFVCYNFVVILRREGALPIPPHRCKTKHTQNHKKNVTS